MGMISVAKLMDKSGVKFGTSGARGLVDDMTDYVCFVYTKAFLNYLVIQKLVQLGDQVMVAGDFRPSSPRIMAAVGLAIEDAGFKAVNCGFVPTPAVALYGMNHDVASIMVTGSHIPDDRNGIKFYKPEGEILKQDEQGMCASNVDVPSGLFDEQGGSISSFIWNVETKDAYALFVDRYTSFFPQQCLQGKRIGVYEHSSVARGVLVDVMSALGADVVRLGFSKKFIPVDTEAVREEDVRLAKQWSTEHGLDCIVSADGDGDRPLVSDELGNWLRGDVAGIICAKYLGVSHVVTPVSCNSAVEKSDYFKSVQRTRIGSPFVIEIMNKLLAADESEIVGYEANGGFLTASDITKEGRSLSALPTRDAVIVPLAILMASIEQDKTISAVMQSLPQRFTASGRLQNFPTTLSAKHLAPLQTGDLKVDIRAAEKLFFETFGQVLNINTIDGVRITFVSEEVIHLRPSGNAPELRCYVEAGSEQRAEQMKVSALKLMGTWVSR
ncbi:MAG: phosphomannomutase [Ghiorsea sp.]